MGTEFGQAVRVWRQHNDMRSATTISKIRVANVRRFNTPKKTNRLQVDMMMMMMYDHDVAY